VECNRRRVPRRLAARTTSPCRQPRGAGVCKGARAWARAVRGETARSGFIPEYSQAGVSTLLPPEHEGGRGRLRRARDSSKRRGWAGRNTSNAIRRPATVAAVGCVSPTTTPRCIHTHFVIYVCIFVYVYMNTQTFSHGYTCIYMYSNSPFRVCTVYV
jgi:hypothetical protein